MKPEDLTFEICLVEYFKLDSEVSRKYNNLYNCNS